MGPTPEKSCECYENTRTVPRYVEEIVRTGKSPIDDLDVFVSDIDYRELCPNIPELWGEKGHMITYVRKGEKAG